MIKRVIWIILDSVGAGELPDAAKYGDAGSFTLSHVSEKANGLKVPNMTRLGLGNIDGMSNIDSADSAVGCYCKMAEISDGKDTTTGHWEMVGIHTKQGFPTYPQGFSDDIIEAFKKAAGVKGVIGNCTASGTEIIAKYGEEHMKTGYPIVYTSADSVFQIACHEDIYSVDELYKMCQAARELLTGENAVARVIARPFTGKVGEFVRTSNRRDFSLSPSEDNLLSYMKAAGKNVAAVGKIEDIFNKVGITQAVHTKDNMDGVDKTLEYMDEVKEGLIFTNLVEFDSKWGHRNDYMGYARGLEEFDKRLPEIMDKMNDDDLLIINADHGCDPTMPGTDHSREYIPVLMYGKQLKENTNLHIRDTFSDIGQTIAEIFDVKELPIGTSMLDEIVKKKTKFRMYDLILKKREGGELSELEINYIIDGFTKGDIPDYQMAAFMMAVYFKGMTDKETVALTMAMAKSGDMLDLSAIDGIKVDKHSTGGVGDKTSLVLTPMVAALGVPVAKMSGRGLGHTGGTIDKLESFRGFTTALTTEKFIENVNKVKVAIMGQTADLAPADKKLYALRDVTATVDNISLIASSIMSKKLAAGADAIVLDVKTGSGAFMKKEEDAFALAKEMVSIGSMAGRNTVAVISDMDQPLGFAVGNALEVKEAIETLDGQGSEELLELCVTLGAYMLIAAKKADNVEEARKMLYKTIEDKSALNKFAEFIEAQGGDSAPVYDTSLLPQASIIREVKAQQSGYIAAIVSDRVGIASLVLGGGRETKESVIDLSVGIILSKKKGEYVEEGDTLAYIYANDNKKAEDAEDIMHSVYSYSVSPVEKSKFIKGIVSL